jgi:simple sugar transport system substrate-binding protein
MRIRRRLWVGLAVAPLVLAGCTGSDDGEGTAASGEGGGGDLSVAVVTHGTPGDAFWSVVKTGAEDAGEELGVSVDYQSDGDPQKQAQLIDAAVNQKVDGLVVSMANPEALRSSVEKAVDAGIPVVTINSGQDESAQYGAITHVGQDEVVAGRGAGEKLAEDGAKKTLCVVHEAGNIGLDQRCTGAEEGLGGTVTRLQVDINNLEAAQSTIQAKLQSDQSIDSVLALNPAIATLAVSAKEAAGSDATIATFDLSEDVITAVQEGQILFAVDQQQYLQGYLPVQFLKLYAQNLNTVGGGEPVLTGPGFVTEENAGKVADLAEQGTR